MSLAALKFFFVLTAFPTIHTALSLVIVRQVKPFLEGELRSRGATVLAWDGTFAGARQVNSEAKVLDFVLNETSHVVAYSAVPSEKWAHVLPMFMG